MTLSLQEVTAANSRVWETNNGVFIARKTKSGDERTLCTTKSDFLDRYGDLAPPIPSTSDQWDSRFLNRLNNDWVGALGPNWFSK